MNQWFFLPRLGRECFAELMGSRVAYNSKLGFKLTSETDISRALGALNSSLPVSSDDGYEVESICFVCGSSLGEGAPKDSVLCTPCASSEDAYALYTMRFVELMNSIS